MKLGALLATHLKRRRAYLQALALLLLAARRALRIVRFRRLRLDLALGTGDPASTGLAKGAAEAVAGFARAKGAPVTLRMRPVFGNYALDVAGEAELSVAPIALLRLLAAVAWGALRKRELRRLGLALARDALRAFLAGDEPEEDPAETGRAGAERAPEGDRGTPPLP